MTYSVNGASRSADGPLPLERVLTLEDVDPGALRGVAVAVNDRLVRRGAWSGTTVSDGDRVEIVTARQGG